MVNNIMEDRSEEDNIEDLFSNSSSFYIGMIERDNLKLSQIQYMFAENQVPGENSNSKKINPDPNSKRIGSELPEELDKIFQDIDSHEESLNDEDDNEPPDESEYDKDKRSNIDQEELEEEEELKSQVTELESNIKKSSRNSARRQLCPFVRRQESMGDHGRKFKKPVEDSGEIIKKVKSLGISFSNFYSKLSKYSNF
jgi:hypothetical protein